MKMSDHGLQFLMGWEGTRNKPYDDGGPGVGNCTVGTGHVIAFRPCTADELALEFSDEEVMDLLRADVERFEDVVNANAVVPLNQNQFDALVDFAFNTGGGYPRVWDAVNGGGDVAGVLAVTAVTPEWARQALTRRRKAEGELYNTEVTRVYDDAAIDAKVFALLSQLVETNRKLEGIDTGVKYLIQIAANLAPRVAALEKKPPP